MCWVQSFPTLLLFDSKEPPAPSTSVLFASETASEWGVCPIGTAGQRPPETIGQKPHSAAGAAECPVGFAILAMHQVVLVGGAGGYVPLVTGQRLRTPGHQTGFNEPIVPGTLISYRSSRI